MISISIQTIYRDSNYFCSFPNIAGQGNTVKIVFRKAGELSLSAAQSGRPTHHDADSVCCIVDSRDGGDTFSKPRVILDCDYGINDPGLSVLSDGRWVLRTSLVEVYPSNQRHKMQHQLLAHRPDVGTVSSVVGQSIQWSQDDGKTWSKYKIITLSNDRKIVSREPIIELEDGSLLLSCYESVPSRTEHAGIIRSWDQGKSWGDYSPLAEDPNGRQSMFRGINYNETALANLGNGKLLAMIRSDESYMTDDTYMAIGGIGELQIALSENTGLSWSEPVRTGIFGQPAHLLKLSDGRWVCTYGYRKKPYQIRAIVTDDPLKWDPESYVVLREGAHIWDMGYPSSFQRQDGKIITAYYWNDDSLDRYIETATWDPHL